MNGENNLIDLTNYYINDVLKIDLPCTRSKSLETCTSSPCLSRHTAGRHTSRRGSKRTLVVNTNTINDKKDDGIVVDGTRFTSIISLTSPTSSVDTNDSNVSFNMNLNIHSKENICSKNLKPIGSESDMINERNIIASIHSTHSRGSRVTNNAPNEQALVVAVPGNVNDDNNNNVNTNNYSYNGILVCQCLQ